MLNLVLLIRSLFLVGALLLMNTVQAEIEVEIVEDLRVLKQQAQSKNVPILLLFTAEDCEFCDAVRINYLIPMLKSGGYESKILIRQIYIEDYSYLRDAKGELISGDVLALKYDVDVTPTILFLNASGKELTKRIIGISNIYYFGEMLDERILQASSALASKSSN